MSPYKQMDEKDFEFIKSVIPAGRIYIGKEINEDYSHDELGDVHHYPDVLVEALSAQEISQILRYANENLIPVVARGSGTGLVGGSVPIYGGIMICTSKMNKILEVDQDNLVATVEPGALLMELSAHVEGFDLFYPPDPGEKAATIGGNIATNAGGMRAVKYGVTRDFVRGLEVVLASGEIVEFGGKVVKNSSGYSLKDLMVGSEGTLGIITKAILKLLPLPKKAISLLIPFNNIDNAIRSVPEIMKTKIIPTAVEFMEREVILDAEEYLGKKFPDKSSDAYLILTYDGNSKEQIEQCYPTVADISFKNGAIDLLIVDTDERKEAVWKARSAFLEAIKGSTTYMDECDVVVPINKVAEFLNYTYQLKQKHDIRIKSFGHAGDGNLHIYILKDQLDDETWHKKLEAVFDDLYRKAIEFNGKVSGEHGIGYAKLPYLKKDVSEAVWNLMKNIKLAFDPNNILNPGKVIK